MADERDPAITTDAIRLHRLVREVAASRCDSAQRDAARRALLAVLAAIYPQDVYRSPASWPRCAVLTPHLIASCETETADATESVQRGQLLELAGGYFRRQAAYSAAEPLLRRALAIAEQALGPEHPDTPPGLRALAIVLHDQGDLAAARSLYERALAIREKALGPEHPATAESLNNLARVLRDQGDLAAARSLFERALAIREKALGPEHPETNRIRSRLARVVLSASGNAREALSSGERALSAHEKVLGPNHKWTRDSVHR